MPHTITDYVREPRLVELIEQLAQFGARTDGGVDRQALTDAELEARRFLAAYARKLGCDALQDTAGNLFFRRHGSEGGAPVMTGSHIDTQPAGGKLDGAYGVCAGLEVIAALRDMRAETRRPIEVVVWANEEGCRFAPGSMGSAAFVDPGRLGDFRATRDARGTSYGECLDRMQRELADIPMRDLQLEVHAFIEAHIEQGPVLEQAQIPIGAVVGIQGVRWYRVRAVGQASHAGTTPLEHRRDALRALTELAGRLYALAERASGLRLTIGTLNVHPGSINTIPGEATLTVDVRHPQESALDGCASLLTAFCAEPRFGCHVSFERSMAMPTTWFSEPVRASIREAADGLGLASMEMMSGAFHDSLHLADHCPTGMLFVPSREGLSHNPTEYTEPRHLLAGTRVLAAAVAKHAELVASPELSDPA
jgi:beta-ureidopropionase / N-carbamoyl-L-amino-acid hydrolase